MIFGGAVGYSLKNVEGLKNSEELIRNNNVDGVMVGPYDLSGSLGIPGDFKNKI